MLDHAYRMGVQAALRKLGGLRVDVTTEQTPQTHAAPVSDAARRQRSVDTLWDNHDSLQQEFTSKDAD